MTLVTLGDVLGDPTPRPELILFCNQSAPAFYRKAARTCGMHSCASCAYCTPGGLRPRRSVLAELQAAYEKVTAKRRSRQ